MPQSLSQTLLTDVLNSPFQGTFKTFMNPVLTQLDDTWLAGCSLTSFVSLKVWSSWLFRQFYPRARIAYSHSCYYCRSPLMSPTTTLNEIPVLPANVKWSNVTFTVYCLFHIFPLYVHMLLKGFIIYCSLNNGHCVEVVCAYWSLRMPEVYKM